MIPHNISGLTDEQVLLAREKFGQNKLDYKKQSEFIDAIKRIAKDPMIILLLAASSIYFASGKIGDGIFMLTAILFQTSISFYQYAAKNGYNESLTRTMTFTVLIAANIFFTLINRSLYYSIRTTLKYKNNMVLFIIFTTITIVSLLLYIKPLTNFFEFETLDSLQLLICILTGFVSVIWFEVVKFIKRKKENNLLSK